MASGRYLHFCFGGADEVRRVNILLLPFFSVILFFLFFGVVFYHKNHSGDYCANDF
jgi:hypothetical protein